MLRRKIGLSKRKYKLGSIATESISKFLKKRYIVFWVVTIIFAVLFLLAIDDPNELWFAVALLYCVFVLMYSAVVILQNVEIGDVEKRIRYLSDGEYEEIIYDEGSLCADVFDQINKITSDIRKLREEKERAEEENRLIKQTITELDERVAKICSGDFSQYHYDSDKIGASGFERLNTLGQVVAQTIESKTAAERTKVELVTNVSHDLKTPLTSIVSYIDLMSKIENLPQEARDYVEIISRKSECLSHTVCDLFDIAKASAMQDIELEEIDGVMLLKQVLADMQDRIEESATPVRESYEDNACKIISNGKKLYRVFQNLLDNALKYSLCGSRIYVSQRSDENNYIVEINNTASYEMTFDASEIQERFVRGDKSRTDEESNGLGLSIVSTFTKACGGEFEVDIDCDRFIARVSFPKIKHLAGKDKEDK